MKRREVVYVQGRDSSDYVATSYRLDGPGSFPGSIFILFFFCIFGFSCFVMFMYMNCTYVYVLYCTVKIRAMYCAVFVRCAVSLLNVCSL
jgi:hypothetical protein